jgi:hypothetical protein
MEMSGQFHAPAVLALLSEIRNASDKWQDGPRTGLDGLDQRRVYVAVQAVTWLLTWINKASFIRYIFLQIRIYVSEF